MPSPHLVVFNPSLLYEFLFCRGLFSAAASIGTSVLRELATKISVNTFLLDTNSN